MPEDCPSAQLPILDAGRIADSDSGTIENDDSGRATDDDNNAVDGDMSLAGAQDPPVSQTVSSGQQAYWQQMVPFLMDQHLDFEPGVRGAHRGCTSYAGRLESRSRSGQGLPTRTGLDTSIHLPSTQGSSG